MFRSKSARKIAIAWPNPLFLQVHKWQFFKITYILNHSNFLSNSIKGVLNVHYLFHSAA